MTRVVTSQAPASDANSQTRKHEFIDIQNIRELIKWNHYFAGLKGLGIFWVMLINLSMSEMAKMVYQKLKGYPV